MRGQGDFGRSKLAVFKGGFWLLHWNWEGGGRTEDKKKTRRKNKGKPQIPKGSKETE